MRIYYGDFENFEDVANSFCVDLDPDEITILYANYSLDGYEGQAFVLFMQNGRLYEVHGAHCSCYGLEDQWEPEETSVLSLKRRIYSCANSSIGVFGTCRQMVDMLDESGVE